MCFENLCRLSAWNSVSILMKDAEDNFSFNQVFYAANPSFEKGNKSASNKI